jgi:hypothetical protein
MFDLYSYRYSHLALCKKALEISEHVSLRTDPYGYLGLLVSIHLGQHERSLFDFLNNFLSLSLSLSLSLFQFSVETSSKAAYVEFVVSQRFQFAHDFFAQANTFIP